MARSTGQYFSGTLGAQPNGQRDLFYLALNTEITAFQSAGVNAWQLYDSTIIAEVAGSRDRVWRSLGDRGLAAGAGDANLFFRMRLGQFGAGVLDFDAYSDWSTSAHAGNRPAHSLGTIQVMLDDANAISYFGVRNEYEFSLCFIQGANVYFLSFGSPIRNHVAPLSQGIARATNAPAAGNNVVFNLDRNISASIQVGQRIWIMDATNAAGQALPADNLENQVVGAVTAATITINTTANAHAVNAILGLDPCPMYFTWGVGIAAPTVYMTSRADGTWVAATNSASVIPQSAGIGSGAGVNNPAPGTNQFVGMTAALNGTAGPTSFRGNFQHLNFWPVGTQVDQDRMVPNFTTSLAQKFFRSLQNSSYGLAIGPGAT